MLFEGLPIAKVVSPHIVFLSRISSLSKLHDARASLQKENA
jgi:hypothetical protein